MANDKDPQESFEEEAVGEQSTFREVWEFLTQNKKWWLAPVIIVLIALGAFVMLSGTAAAPFIYTLF